MVRASHEWRIGWKGSEKMKGQRRVISTALLLLGALLAIRAVNVMTNRWTHDDGKVFPLSCASVASVAIGVYLRRGMTN